MGGRGPERPRWGGGVGAEGLEPGSGGRGPCLPGGGGGGPVAIQLSGRRYKHILQLIHGLTTRSACLEQ